MIPPDEGLNKSGNVDSIVSVETIHLVGLEVDVVKLASGKTTFRLSGGRNVNELSLGKRSELLAALRFITQQRVAGVIRPQSQRVGIKPRPFIRSSEEQQDISIADVSVESFGEETAQSEETSHRSDTSLSFQSTMPLPTISSGLPQNATPYKSDTPANVPAATPATSIHQRISRLTHPMPITLQKNAVKRTINEIALSDIENSKRYLPQTEFQHHLLVRHRMHKQIQTDQQHVIRPKTQRPFQSFSDAVKKLLPYHIYHEDHNFERISAETEACKTRMATLKNAFSVMCDDYNKRLEKDCQEAKLTVSEILLNRYLIEDMKQENAALKQKLSSNRNSEEEKLKPHVVNANTKPIPENAENSMDKNVSKESTTGIKVKLTLPKR